MTFASSERGERSDRKEENGTVLTDLIKVEGKVSGNGAVEARLNERCPLIPELVRTAPVLRADARHSRKHCFPAIDVLHRRLAQEEVHVVVVVHRAHEVGRVQVLRVELFRPERRSIDQRIRS